MLDHLFTDAISALRDAFESAFLERLAFEEQLEQRPDPPPGGKAASVA
jgi:hypothetical protein